jgi:hypothetical protein
VPVQEVQQGCWTPIEYRVVDVNVKNLKPNGARVYKGECKELYSKQT